MKYLVLALVLFLVGCQGNLQKAEAEKPAKPSPAKAAPLIKIVDSDSQMLKTQDVCVCLMWIKFDVPTKQDFKFEVSPNFKMWSTRSDRIIVWLVENYQAYKPKTAYLARLSSSKPFSYKGKKLTEIKWQFKTPNADVLKYYKFDEERTRILSPIKYPVDVFLPIELEAGPNNHYRLDIAEREQDTYCITISEIPFNLSTQTGEMTKAFVQEKTKDYYNTVAKAKQKALQLIRQTGQNPAELKIEWIYEKY